LAAAALGRLDGVGPEELGSERLREFAEKQPAEICQAPDALHLTKLRVNRGMPEEQRLAMYPLFADGDLVLTGLCLLANADAAAHPQPNGEVDC
jgi:hypothetical protein